MKFIYGKNDFKTLDRGQELTYLLVNGLGGFSSTTIINSLTRSDQALFMACVQAPNNRINIVSKVNEVLHIGKDKIDLSSQQYVCYTKNKEGHVHLHSFKQEYLPEWTYFYDGVEIKKTIVFEHGKNTLAIKYTIENNSGENVSLEVTPIFQFANKGDVLAKPHKYNVNLESTINCISANNIDLRIYSNYSKAVNLGLNFENDYYFAYDSRDGRNSVGSGTSLVSYYYNCDNNNCCDFDLIFTIEDDTKVSHIVVDELINEEISRQNTIIDNSRFKDELAKALVRASDQFITDRESTNGKTIIAGYPFFADWGRDTMFALLGSCISTKRFDYCKDILRTFMKHINKGLMPNLFPEGEAKPLYNTVDASLLFIYAVYEYYQESNDLDFIKNEAIYSMIEIINWYKKGTDFNIYMDEDGLIVAGQGYDQVTWMDVRFDDILPTARHGKPVEINAFWYNALKATSYFLEKINSINIESNSNTNLNLDLYNLTPLELDKLAEQVKTSFQEKFWNDKENCLKDVVSGNNYDNQVRSNQIWAVMVPFSPLNLEKSKAVVNKVYRELYTPYGLRSLSKYDKEFVPEYSGSHFKRDMSYHQGTVWTFPLGGYYLAYLKVNNYSEEAKLKVREQISYFESCLKEGCIGQIAEIYDGLYPNESRGCFAQAWSVSEILRALSKAL